MSAADERGVRTEQSGTSHHPCKGTSECTSKDTFRAKLQGRSEGTSRRTSEAADEATACGAPASPSGEIAVLEPALWRQLGDTTDKAARAASWAVLVTRLIPGTRQASVVLAGANGFAPVALWPAGEPPDELLMAAVDGALAQRAGAVRMGQADGAGREAAVALPLLAGSQLLGAAVVVLTGADESRTRAAMRQLQWGAGWLRGDARPPDSD